MSWAMAFIMSGPYILIIYYMIYLVLKKIKRHKKPKLTLIRGEKRDRGPYGKSR